MVTYHNLELYDVQIKSLNREGFWTFLLLLELVGFASKLADGPSSVKKISSSSSGSCTWALCPAVAFADAEKLWLWFLVSSEANFNVSANQHSCWTAGMLLGCVTSSWKSDVSSKLFAARFLIFSAWVFCFCNSTSVCCSGCSFLCSCLALQGFT